MLNGATHVYDEAAGRDIGEYVDPAGRFTMSCVRVSRTDCPIRVDFRRIAGWACAIFELGDWRDPDPTNLGPYTVAVAGQHIDVPHHWCYARWRWQSGAWPLPLVSIAELTAKRLLPRFDASVNGGTAMSPGNVTYSPMNLAGISPDMGSGGERPDIGIVTDWQAEYICTQTPRSLANVLAQGEAGGTIPCMYRDLQTNALIDGIVGYPRATQYTPQGPGTPYVPPAVNTMIHFDGAHDPALNYLPFALTGDPYFLENLQAQVMQDVIAGPRPVTPQFWIGQIRAQAWFTRSLMQTVRCTPDRPPSWLLPRAPFKKLLDWNLAGLTALANRGDPPCALFHTVAAATDWGDRNQTDDAGNIVQPAGTYYAPWMEDFLVAIEAWTAMLFPEWMTVLRWNVQTTIARTSSASGWSRAIPTPYHIKLRDSETAPWYATWGEAWRRNAPAFNAGGLALDGDLRLANPGDYDYPNGTRAALAMALQAGVDEAKGPLDWISAQLMRGFKARRGGMEYKWSIAGG